MARSKSILLTQYNQEIALPCEKVGSGHRLTGPIPERDEWCGWIFSVKNSTFNFPFSSFALMFSVGLGADETTVLGELILHLVSFSNPFVLGMCLEHGAS